MSEIKNDVDQMKDLAEIAWSDAYKAVEELKKSGADYKEADKKCDLAKLQMEEAMIACFKRDNRNRTFANQIVENIEAYPSFSKCTIRIQGRAYSITSQMSDELKEINILTEEICRPSRHHCELVAERKRLMKEKKIVNVYYIDNDNDNTHIFVMFPSSMMKK